VRRAFARAAVVALEALAHVSPAVHEAVLDLVERGHRLVADDVVEIRKYPNGSLVGRVDFARLMRDIGLGLLCGVGLGVFVAMIGDLC